MPNPEETNYGFFSNFSIFPTGELVHLPEVLNLDGKTLQFQQLAAPTTMIIENGCIKQLVLRQK
jgi:hypothetical protein